MNITANGALFGLEVNCERHGGLARIKRAYGIKSFAMADPGFLKGGGGKWVADLTEPYRKNLRKIASVIVLFPFLISSLNKPQRWGWLATQTTPSGSAPTLCYKIIVIVLKLQRSLS